MEKLVDLQHRNIAMENVLRNEKVKLDDAVEGLVSESQKSMAMEASLEKQLTEFDIEREQMRQKLLREEGRSRELAAEVERLKLQLQSDVDGAGIMEVRKPGVGEEGTSQRQMPHTVAPVRHPTNMQPQPRVTRDSPPSSPPEVRKLPIVHIGADSSPGARTAGTDSTGVKRTIRQFNTTGDSPSPAGGRSPDRAVYVEKPKPPTDKPAVDTSASRVNIISSGAGSVFTSPSGNTTVFTTPSGTRISLNVGPVTSSSATSATSPSSPGQSSRKSVPAGRGVPPPVPPNKPQVYIPPSQSAARKDNMVSNSRPKSPGPTKYGITITKDRITIISPEHPGDGVTHVLSQPIVNSST